MLPRCTLLLALAVAAGAVPECSVGGDAGFYMSDSADSCTPAGAACPTPLSSLGRQCYADFFAAPANIDTSRRNIDYDPLQCNPCAVAAGEFIPLAQWRACLLSVPLSEFVLDGTIDATDADRLYGQISLADALGRANWPQSLQTARLDARLRSDAEMWGYFVALAHTMGDAHFRWTLGDGYSGAEAGMPFKLQPNGAGGLRFELEDAGALPADVQASYEMALRGALDFDIADLLGRRVVEINGAPVSEIGTFAAQNYEAVSEPMRRSLAAVASLPTMIYNWRGAGLPRMVFGELALALKFENDTRTYELPYIVRVLNALDSAADLEALNVNDALFPPSVSSYAAVEQFLQLVTGPTTLAELLQSLPQTNPNPFLDPIACDGCAESPAAQDAFLVDLLARYQLAGAAPAGLTSAPAPIQAPLLESMVGKRAARAEDPAQDPAFITGQAGWQFFLYNQTLFVNINGPYDNSFGTPSLLAALQAQCNAASRIVFNYAFNPGGQPTSAQRGLADLFTEAEYPQLAYGTIFNAGPAASEFYMINALSVPFEYVDPYEVVDEREFLGSRLQSYAVDGSDVRQRSTPVGTDTLYARLLPEAIRSAVGCYSSAELFYAVNPLTASAASMQAVTAKRLGLGTAIFLDAWDGEQPGAPRSAGTAFIFRNRAYSLAEQPPTNMVTKSAPTPEATYVWINETTNLDQPSAYVAAANLEYDCILPAGPHYDTRTGAGRANLASWIERGGCGCPVGSCTCDDGCPAGQYRTPADGCAACELSCNGLLVPPARAQRILDAGACESKRAPEQVEPLIARQACAEPYPNITACGSTFGIPTYPDAEGACGVFLAGYREIDCPRLLRVRREPPPTFVLEVPLSDTEALYETTVTGARARSDLTGSTDATVTFGSLGLDVGMGVATSFDINDIFAQFPQYVHGVAMSFSHFEALQQPLLATTRLLVEVHSNDRSNSDFEAMFGVATGVPRPTFGANAPRASGSVAATSVVAWREAEGDDALVWVPFDTPMNLFAPPFPSLGLTFTVRVDYTPTTTNNTDIPLRFGFPVDESPSANAGVGRLLNVENYNSFFGRTVYINVFTERSFAGYSLPLSPMLYPYGSMSTAPIAACPIAAQDCFGDCYGGGVIEDGECILPIDCAGELNGSVGENACGVCDNSLLECVGCDGVPGSGQVSPGALPHNITMALDALTACGTLRLEDWIAPRAGLEAPCLTAAYLVDELCEVTNPGLEPSEAGAWPLWGITHPYLRSNYTLRYVPPRPAYDTFAELHGIAFVATSAQAADPGFAVDFCVHNATTSAGGRLLPVLEPENCARVSVGELAAAGPGPRMHLALADDVAWRRPTGGYFLSMRVDREAAQRADARVALAGTATVTDAMVGDERLGGFWKVQDNVFVPVEDLCVIGNSPQGCFSEVPHMYPILEYAPENQVECAAGEQ